MTIAIIAAAKRRIIACIVRTGRLIGDHQLQSELVAQTRRVWQLTSS
ncbi:hypothetical protein LQG66_31750 [Bradyrhizobium ontarionense]|uniref:Transposase n=1 Tax=Bradyrhizobium ontarionense TaxID=2898149 RepID=A0ABY3R9V0_9BRAD|nr:hypothetical protein [Bradyrhizobium sp. A19]UFZ03734.1 hypothetical protein LQG66_31750 [Bradyrhizobium sp. A19]